MKFPQIYIDNEFKLFPVSNESKLPCIKNNLTRASFDLETIRLWGAKFPSCNWGISLAQSGLVAVDIDHKHGGMEYWASLIEKNGEPKTLSATTGSGGKHYIFLDEEKSFKGKILSGIDIKHNGYVIVWPSINQKTGKQYTWDNWGAPITPMPEWLLKLAEKRIIKVEGEEPVKFSNDYLSKLVSVLKYYPLNFEEWVHAGMAIHASEPNEKGRALFLDLTRGESYVEGDIEWANKKWDSFHEGGGITPLTLAFLIRKKGGSVPSATKEEDKWAFRNNQEIELYREKIEREAEREETKETFYERDGKLVCWSSAAIAEYFNKQGLAVIEDGSDSTFAKINEVDEEINVMRLGKVALQNTYANLKRISVKATASEIKIVLTPAIDEWISAANRTQYKGIVFDPNLRPTKDFLNLWQGFKKISPDFHTDKYKVVTDFIFLVLCCENKEKFEWLMQWLAHILQSPGHKATTVPVFIGGEGAGKGLLFDHIMKPILSPYYAALSTAEDVTSRFNGHMFGKLLSYIDEATWRGNKTEDGILKRLIGSPTFSIEEKFGKRKEIENFSRYAIASNNEEAVALSLGNRRYMVFETNPIYANDLKYFGPLGDSIRKKEVLESFLGHLLSIDLTDFNPYKILNDNQGEISKIRSAGITAEFWRDVMISPERFWEVKKGLNSKLAYNAFLEFTNSVKTYEKNLSKNFFWKTTEKLIGDIEKNRLRNNGGLIYFRSISPKEFFDLFSKNLKIKNEMLEESEYIYNENEGF